MRTMRRFFVRKVPEISAAALLTETSYFFKEIRSICMMTSGRGKNGIQQQESNLNEQVRAPPKRTPDLSGMLKQQAKQMQSACPFS